MAAGGSGLSARGRNADGAILPQHVTWGWRMLPMPVIAAVHGVAFGGGFQIMSGADIRIAAPTTRFAIRETHWGLVPDMAGFPICRTLVRDDRSEGPTSELQTLMRNSYAVFCLKKKTETTSAF